MELDCGPRRALTIQMCRIVLARLGKHPEKSRTGGNLFSISEHIVVGRSDFRLPKYPMNTLGNDYALMKWRPYRFNWIFALVTLKPKYLANGSLPSDNSLVCTGSEQMAPAGEQSGNSI